jgi:tRNA (guanine-N7-)-methyltransferase
MSTLILAIGGRRESLESLEVPLSLDELLPGGDSWEVEIGFGKGRFLLATAEARPSARFLGIEVASKYFRLAERRSSRRGLGNLVLVRGEALYLLSAVLPRAFASAVHVYFPDPWPKDRHHKRRLFDRDTVDLVLGLLAPAGTLFFATDHTEYGDEVSSLLASHPALDVMSRSCWPEGPRTNYELKYEREERRIVRLEATLRSGAADLVHPDGVVGILSARSESPV